MLSDWLPMARPRGISSSFQRCFLQTEAATIAEEFGLGCLGGSVTSIPRCAVGAGTVVAARNVLELLSPVGDALGAARIARRTAQCRCRAGFFFWTKVRVLFFDKPPDRTWALAAVTRI